MVIRSSWLLDTNIISEAMRPLPNAQVMRCLSQYSQELAIAAPVWHELRYGWLRMPDGKRKEAIGDYVQQVVGVLPIFAYDEVAARIHAQLRSEHEQKGLSLPFVDGQIASIAIAHGMTLVTRNLKDFSGIQGLRVVNWFDA
jgi:tRNA(fMet)-specific endonuclease VapC